MNLGLALVVGLIPAVSGLFVLVRSTQRRCGLLLIAHGLCCALFLGSVTSPSTGHLYLVVDQLTQGSWTLLFLWIVLVAYLLPDGNAGSAARRRWIRVGLAGNLAFWVGAAADAGDFTRAHGGQRPPVPLPAALGVLGVAGLVVVVLFFFGAAVHVWWRVREGSAEERLKLLWVVWGSLGIPVGLCVEWVNYFALGRQDWLTTAGLVVATTTLPVTIAVAIVRHRLFDIRKALSRTLLYLSLLALAIGAYGVSLVVAYRLFGSRSVDGAIAVAVIAIAAQPAYSLLRRRIERWVYGMRAEPHLALRMLADRAECADPGALGIAVTDAVRDAIKADSVRVGPVGSGVPLVHRGEQLGDLVLDLPAGRVLTPADEDLLFDLARYAAVLVKSERLHGELRDSRARIVSGREEERRRLRRDLHDGVGPSLAALVLKLNAATSCADPAEHDAIVEECIAEVRIAIGEVRRVVDDLRPAAVDEIGLLPAIRQRAEALSGDLVVEVDGPVELPALPAAVEVAAYRIASEGITNAARHSGATRCRVTISMNGAFEVTISDNGTRAAPDATTGVGWTSMIERAAELGGTCTIAPGPEGGLIVVASLPCEHVLDGVP